MKTDGTLNATLKENHSWVERGYSFDPPSLIVLLLYFTFLDWTRAAFLWIELGKMCFFVTEECSCLDACTYYQSLVILQLIVWGRGNTFLFSISGAFFPGDLASARARGKTVWPWRRIKEKRRRKNVSRNREREREKALTRQKTKERQKVSFLCSRTFFFCVLHGKKWGERKQHKFWMQVGGAEVNHFFSRQQCTSCRVREPWSAVT